MALGHDALGATGIGDASSSSGASTPHPDPASEHARPRPILWAIFPPKRRNAPPLGQQIPPWTTFTQTVRDGFRAADTSAGVERYELYVGEDGPPNFAANPVATSQSLPFSWAPTPPPSGQLKVLHVVVRQRNKYGLSSFNVMERLVTINSSSAEDLGPVTAPEDVAVIDTTTGYVKVLATYTGEDDRNPADTWEVYVSTSGVDPVPGVSVAAASVAMAFGFGAAGLNRSLGPYTEGSDIRVIVTAKRASDSRRGSAAVVEHTMASTLDLEDADLFGGGSFT